MLKGYFVQIPPTLAEVLADIGNTSPDDEFDDIVNAAVQSFFSFWTPHYITNSFAQELEKYVLNYFIMRRVGSGNIKKWKQIFRNKWMSIMPYYERILETIEKENNYFSNPILTADIRRSEEESGTLDETQDTTHNADTIFNTKRDEDYSGSGTHTTDDDIDKTKTQNENLTHSGNDSKNHSGNFAESGHSTEINRYLDTPQSVADRVWETDAQGRLKLSDYYLTDIRAITNDYEKSGTDAYNEAGTNAYTDVKTTNITEGETLDRDETSTNTYDKGITGTDNTDLDETGKKVTDQDTTHNSTVDRLGYDGYSPSDLMMRYRDTFTRTFDDITTELEECFYNLVEVDDLIDFV